MENNIKNKQKLKIAMIGHKYVPSREGGVEIVVEQLSKRLVELGNEVTLFNRKRKEYKEISEYGGCKVKTVYTVNKKSLDAVVYSYFATIKAKKAAKRGEFDVLHFHAEGPCLFLNRLPKRKRRNYKVVVTIHGLDWQRGKWGGFATKVLLKGERRAVKYADEIIVLSENNKKYFKEKYGRDVTYIPNGITAPVFHEPEIINDKWGLGKNSYVLFLARIVPEKGVHYLIDAWKQVKNTIGTDKKLVIAGGSSHSDIYYKQIEDACSGEDSIIMTGFVEGQALQELFTNAYLYVLPSDIEGMPISLLEAISYGNTCLVSDIPENTENLPRDGYTFPKGNIAELAKKLVELISEGKGGRREAVIPFTWEEVADKTLEVYLR
ncbi:MAG: glycosyltransferase family 4 protein [Clostridia bacterium]|nr:glycosyltransferase family 4 protein [Clostridia bacterium]